MALARKIVLNVAAHDPICAVRRAGNKADGDADAATEDKNVTQDAAECGNTGESLALGAGGKGGLPGKCDGGAGQPMQTRQAPLDGPADETSEQRYHRHDQRRMTRRDPLRIHT